MEVEALSRIIDRALARVMKWCPPTLDIEDITQEAWVAILEAQRKGITSKSALQKAVELYLRDQVMSKEAERREVPTDQL